MIDHEMRYPLQWPDGEKRTREPKRSQFHQTRDSAKEFLLEELRRLGATSVVITTNIGPYRKDDPTRLLAKGTNHPNDVGVAIYFEIPGMGDKSMSCDKFTSIQENMYAIGMSIEAMRGLERWGSSTMLSRVFMGFAALPPPRREDWWTVLGVKESASLDEVRAARRRCLIKAHPDGGGSREAMERIDAAARDYETIKGVTL